MNRSELIERVRTAYYTADSSTPSDPEALIDFAIRNAFREILRALKSGESVTIHEFGSWTVQTQAERSRYNVNTRELQAARSRPVIRFHLARSNPLSKIADDTFAMPSEFETPDDLVGWLATAASSIQSWKDHEKAIAAWNESGRLRATMLSADQNLAICAVMEKTIADFRERFCQGFRDLDTLRQAAGRARDQVRKARNDQC
jgi:nucleoid DNA-binding protein